VSGLFGIEVPNILEAKRVLAVQPHYDDNDISMGGTLAALAENGAELYYLTMSDDLVGVIDETWSEEEATKRLRDDQARAGEIIGVKQQYWLGYPDAGEFNYFDVRRDIIKHMRIVRPDILVTMDPWMLYEAHQDHVIAGRAAAEAAILYDFVRLKTESEVDENYEPHPLKAVVFHATSYPNTIFDISGTLEKKKQAICCYKAQFHESAFEGLVNRTMMYTNYLARDEAFEYGEALKVMPPGLLHGVGEAIHF
jgi:LmbE family N-acetylglucosaminyl deacetylase